MHNIPDSLLFTIPCCSRDKLPQWVLLETGGSAGHGAASQAALSVPAHQQAGVGQTLILPVSCCLVLFMFGLRNRPEFMQVCSYVCLF